MYNVLKSATVKTVNATYFTAWFEINVTLFQSQIPQKWDNNYNEFT